MDGGTSSPTLPTGLVKGYCAKFVRVVMDLSVSRRYFHFFGPLKKHLAGKRFATYADVRQTVNSWTDIAHRFFTRRYINLATVGKMLMSVVTTSKSGVYHVLPMCHVYIEDTIMFSAS